MAASLDLSSKQVKFSGDGYQYCGKCSPHKGCNRTYHKYRYKKQYQIMSRKKKSNFTIKEFINEN